MANSSAKKTLDTPIYPVSSRLYRETFMRLTDAIGPEHYFSGTLAFPFDETECRLTVSVIVYRSRVVQPEGSAEPITDLVPVWWEFHTVRDGDELPNDFDFGELKCRL